MVTAAGSSRRFGSRKKELELLPDGSPVLQAALAPFLELPGLRALVVTAPAGAEAELRAAAGPRAAALGESFLVVEGGASRRDSVRQGLEALAAFLAPESGAEEALVLVHDGARPWASAELAARALAAARLHGAVVPLVPVTDTIKERTAASGADSHLVTAHPSRAGLGAAQTPQAFRYGPLLAAHRRAASEGLDCTDDAELWARYQGPVAWIEGEESNRKITYAADLPAGGQASPAGGCAAQAGGVDAPGSDGAAQRAARGTTAPDAAGAGPAASACPFRVGEGWDLHRLAPGRPLVLGGVRVPADFGEEAWSDGDVLLHAAIDALLGAAALGDIGTHFPPSDPRWRGADSRELAARTAALVRGAGWEPVNLDCTVVLERPRLGPHREAIRAGLATAFGMEVGAVSVKAKTSEGVDAAGEGRAVEARAVVLVARRVG